MLRYLTSPGSLNGQNDRQVEQPSRPARLRLLMRKDKVWPMSWKSDAAAAEFRGRHMTPGKRLRISLRAICHSRGCRRSTAAATYLRSPTSNVRSSIRQPCFVHRTMWSTTPSCPSSANAKFSGAGLGTNTCCKSQATKRCRRQGTFASQRGEVRPARFARARAACPGHRFARARRGEVRRIGRRPWRGSRRRIANASCRTASSW